MNTGGISIVRCLSSMSYIPVWPHALQAYWICLFTLVAFLWILWDFFLCRIAASNNRNVPFFSTYFEFFLIFFLARTWSQDWLAEGTVAILFHSFFRWWRTDFPSPITESGGSCLYPTIVTPRAGHAPLLLLPNSWFLLTQDLIWSLVQRKCLLIRK